jgi:hypothetical protein
MSTTQLLILLLLSNIVCATYIIPSFKQKLKQLLETHPPEYDNQYVWFTRNIHSEQNQQQLRKKNFTRFFYRKETTVKEEDLFIT